MVHRFKTFCIVVITNSLFSPLDEIFANKGPEIGCVVISGTNTSMFTICGNEIKDVHSFNVELPNKHRRGGQSSVRFERLRKEARANYITKVSEIVIRLFKSVIICGPSKLKDDLVDKLNRVSKVEIIKVCTTASNKRAGLDEMLINCGDVIELASTANERLWIKRFFDSVNIGDDKAVYGHDDVIDSLQSGALHVLICGPANKTDELIDLCNDYSTELVLITNSAEGNQIIRDYGGLVGILRYVIGA